MDESATDLRATAYRVVAKCSARLWKQSDGVPRYSLARLPISLGKPAFEEEKLRALVAWTARQFATIEVCLSDTLQRFNLMRDTPTLSEAEAYRRSRDNGTRWLDEYRRVLDAQRDQVVIRILRWDQHLSEARAQGYVALVATLYEEDQGFRRSVDHDIDSYLRRQGAVASVHTRALSRRFILEEVAGYCARHADDQAINIYPGTSMETLYAISRGNFPALAGVMRRLLFVRVDFRRRKRARGDARSTSASLARAGRGANDDRSLV